VNAQQVGNLIARSGPYRVSNEAALHADISDVIARSNLVAWSEYRASDRDRFDFFIDGGICVELKVKGQGRAILKQLERYAALDCVSAILLVTLKALEVPADIGGKPVYVVNLGRQWL